MTDQELADKIRELTASYTGDSSLLFSAINAAWMAQLMGWRFVRLTVSRNVYARNQRILGFDFKDRFPERTAFTKKSVGLEIVDRYDALWEAVANRFDRLGKLERTELREL